MGVPENQKNDIAEAYDAYADMLYRLALSHLQNSHDAQDAVHDVFVKYASSSSSFKDEEHRRAWLLRVTVNRCRDLLRRRKIRSYIPFDNIGEIAAPDHQTPIPEIISSLAGAGAKNTPAIVLHYLEGYSVEKTAALLGISVSAVKMRLKRGREALRKHISEVEE